MRKITAHHHGVEGASICLCSLMMSMLFVWDVSVVAAQEQAKDEVFESKNASQECARDRRCRIDRLKRQNRARRYMEIVDAEEEALEFQRHHAQTKRREVLRLVRPFNVSFGATPWGTSLSAGYTLWGKWRLEGKVLWLNTQYVEETVNIQGVESFVDGSTDALFGGLQAIYLFNPGWWSPYVGGEALYGRGSLLPSYYEEDFGFGGLSIGEQMDLTYHLVGAAVGVDLQLDWGLRGRVGLTARHPLFVNARSNDVIVQYARKMITTWFEEEQRFGFEISIGWAF